MDKVYIVQSHENTGDNSDSVEVYKTLREAASAYNKAIECTAEIFGDTEYKTSCLQEGDVKEGEGKDINLEYEVTDGGVTHTIALYSQNMK